MQHQAANFVSVAVCGAEAVRALSFSFSVSGDEDEVVRGLSDKDQMIAKKAT